MQDDACRSKPSFDLPPSEIEGCVDDAKRGKENAQRTNPLDMREQYERQLKEFQEAYGEATLELRARKNCSPCWARKRSDQMIHQGPQADGIHISISKLCRWFDVPRQSVCYRPVKAAPKVQDALVQPIKKMIEENFGYRTVAHLLAMNKNTVLRIFQIKGRHVRKRPIGFRPRTEVRVSAADKPNQHWATDLCRVWTGSDGWAVLALVADCCSRELLGWHLSRSGKSKTAESALEHALIARFGRFGRVEAPFLLRSDNGLVFTSRSHTALVRSYGLRQEFITPHTPQQNGLIERLIQTLKELCVHRHRFETRQHASRVMGGWIEFYNRQRPYQSLGMKTPAQAFALAA